MNSAAIKQVLMNFIRLNNENNVQLVGTICAIKMINSMNFFEFNTMQSLQFLKQFVTVLLHFILCNIMQ